MATPFDSLADYLALPRIEGLALSPDGSRVVLTVATLKKDATGFDRSLWAVPADGSDGATRLTRSAKGESAPAFTAAGDVLFVSARPDSEAEEDDESGQLWILPATGGDARAVTRLAGGVGGIAAVAEASPHLVISADLLPSAPTIEADATLRAARKKKKVAAILHESYPVRYWDHDLGPEEPHLLALDLDALSDSVGAVRDESAAAEESEKDAPTPYPASLPRPSDLTPRPGRSADAAGIAISPDGATVVAALRVPEGMDARYRLVAIDVASGAHTILFDEPRVDFEAPVVSHDGASLAYVRSVKGTPAGPTEQELWVSALDGSGARRIAAEWDRWPSSVSFDAGDDALVVTADQNGRGPVFRVPLDGAAPVQVTDDDFTYTDVRVDRSSGDLVALRSSWMAPPHPVRIARDGAISLLAAPVALPEVPATMADVETTASDGARVRGWLLLPSDADAPAPLLLWIHGGPLNSWNAWSWRWNPQLAVARGYAVLLPDPALSTGY
ncbi:MAG: S9 family peptidase, partial [Microbacterium sp.]